MHQTIRSRILAVAGRTLPALVTVLTLAGFAHVAHATDTTAPTSLLNTPSANAHITSTTSDTVSPLSIGGTANDAESGVNTVTVRLQRAWGWNTEYWTGSTWSTTATNLTVSLGTADGSGTRTWNVTSSLPYGAAFGTGQYSIWRQVKDAANNTSSAQTVNFYANTDGTTPSVTLEPDDNQIFPSFTDENGCIIRGTAQDLGGGAGAGATSLGRVQVRLYKNSSSVNYYWTGNTTTGWTTTVTNLQTTWGTPDANGQVSWQCTADMPVPDNGLASVYYVIRIDAFDRSGNTVNISSNIGISPEDTIPPTVSVTSPTEGAYLTSLSQVTGTASDAGTVSSGLARVDVRLRRVVNGQTQYWNGSAWTTTTSYLASRTELSWVRNTSLPGGANLPAGAYSLLVTAYDNYNNGSSNVTRNFYIDQVPQAQSQSLGAQKNVARPITLTATDTDNDAITYTVATQPSHGTLTGTAPDLTYTPASNYTGSDSFTFTAGDWSPNTTTGTVTINVVDDTTNPTGSITEPVTSPPLSGTVTAFNGTSNDADSGVASVALYLYRDWGGTSEYWTGSGWSTTAPAIDAVLGTDVNGARNWNWPSNTPLPTGLSTGRYFARATVRDFANRTAVVTKSFFSGQDSVTPTVALTAPGASISRLTAVNGTATDADSGISQVQFRLRRSSDNQYWNGTGWTATTTALSTTVTATGVGNNVTWTRTADLPLLSNGTYTILPIAIDRYNNSGFGSTFTFVVANQYPAANSQSVTAVGHYGRAGDPTNITLTATDSNGDAITGYTVVTQPTHGTLSGTAPNLIYTSDVDYIGGDSFTFAAKDFAGVNGNSATVSINVVEPPPVDALIKSSGDLDYIGDDILSADGTNQTVSQTAFGGETATYHVKVEKEVAAGSIVLKVTGTAESSGWTVRYYDALTNGLDITTAVTSANGWTPQLNAASLEFRVEVIPPSNLTSDSNLTLLVSAGKDGVPSTTDVVKAITTGKPAAQPDLEIKLAADPNYIGANVLNIDGTNQSKSIPLPVQKTQVFNLRVQNTSAFTSDLVVQGEAIPAGWTVKYFDAPTGGNEVTASVIAGGWRLANMVAGATREFRAEIKANYPAPEDHPFKITARTGPQALDVAKAEVLPQWIDHLEYNTDGADNFLPLPANDTITVIQGAPFTLRAIPGRDRDPNSILDWPIISAKVRPEWTNLSQNNLKSYGSQIGVQQNMLTGGSNQPYAEIQAECGNVKTAKVQVQPAGNREIDIWQDIKGLPGTNGALCRVVAMLVTDGFGNPVSGAVVSLQGSGFTVVGNSSASTDAGGYVSFAIETTGGNTATVTASTSGGSQAGNITADCQVTFQ